MKQKTYDWRGDLAEAAQKAVNSFFEKFEQFVIPQNRADYVKWAVPLPEEGIDSNGRKYPILPDIYPYMWKRMDEETDPEKPVSWGSVFGYIADHSHRPGKACFCMIAFSKHLHSIYQPFKLFLNM